MTLEEMINESVTRHTKAVFPNTENANGALFGGLAMKWMDEVAYITATRFTRMRMVTVTCENIRFLQAIPPNTIVEIIGRIGQVGVLKLPIEVEVIAEEMYSGRKYRAIAAQFIMAATDTHGKPARVNFSQLYPQAILQNEDNARSTSKN